MVLVYYLAINNNGINVMSALQDLLARYREISQTEREKGTYFENLIIQYFKNEASYKDLYSHVWTFSDWAALQGLPKNDAGIDLVAKTQGTNEFHAIQCLTVCFVLIGIFASFSHKHQVAFTG